MQKTWRIMLAMAVAAAVLVPSAVVAGQEAAPRTTLEVDVAEDGFRFVFGEPKLDNGFPAYGSAFVTQGYIYEAGTLDEHNGINADGSPAFPDKVIGTWTCWGYFVGEGADTTEGPWVVTTQTFDFHGDVPGGDTLVTVGFETPAGAEPAIRTVTGGSGTYLGAAGEVEQVTLGHNLSDGVNATFEFTLNRNR